MVKRLKINRDRSNSIGNLVEYPIGDPIAYIQECNLDIINNHIYLVSESSYVQSKGDEEPGVEYLMANRFIKNLNILMRKSADSILIHMKTCGGDWQEGMAIYDAIKSCPNPITILNYTHARSMSSLIFQAANKRVMMPNSIFMFHTGTLVVGGTVKQVETEVRQNELTSPIMLSIYIDSMKKDGRFKKWSRDRIKDWLISEMDKKEEVYLSANQSVEYGFADEVFGSGGVYDWSKLLTYSDEQLRC